jgi:alkylation response protein AidB-like acyl-CoA dehydrogenase
LLSADDAGLVGSVEVFLERELSTARLRERLRTGTPYADDAWTAAGSLGVFSLGLPVEARGTGLPAVEEALVFRALGRHLAPVSFLGQVLGARIAQAAGNTELRDAVAEGRSRIGLLLPSGAAYDLPGSDHALCETGAGVALVSTAALPVTEPLECLDPTTSLTVLDPAGVAPTAAVDGAAGEDLRLLGVLLTAAMLVGIAEATRDAAVAYAKQRVQSGRLIGANQAVKHPCADMATRCEAASSLLFFAALALRDGRSDAAFQVAAAKRIATGAAYDNSRANVQIHGAMGVTWEHDAHLFVTRTRVLDHLFGDLRAQQKRLLTSSAAVP